MTQTEFFPTFLTNSAESKAKAKQGYTQDYEIAQKVAAGDMELFEQLYNENHKRVFNICLRMVRNASEAEDITQQVFINLFRKIGSFRGDAAFKTWLHRMTVNQVLMYLRHNKLTLERMTDDGELPSSNSFESEKPAEVHQVIERLNLNRALKGLADGYRKVIILHDIHGFEHEEIAQMLNCAVGTSKSQLHKARQRLRQILNS